MKKTRKILAMVCALCLTAVLAVGGTLAYLTSTTDVVENTFTVGKVTIKLDEAKVDAYGVEVKDAARVTANEYKLIPGHNYAKDPTVHVVAGSEECYLFVKVVDGLEKAEADTTIADQMAAKGWTAVADVANVFVYNDTVNALEATEDIDVVVFEEFTLKNDVDVTAYENAEITITAYAVQADGFDEYTAKQIWDAAKFA